MTDAASIEAARPDEVRPYLIGPGTGPSNMIGSLTSGRQRDRVAEIIEAAGETVTVAFARQAITDD